MSSNNSLYKKTILQVLPSLDTGGVERGTIEISEAISLSKGKSIVVSKGGRLEEQVESSGGTHIKLPVHSKNPFFIIKNIFLLQKVIKTFSVDLIHVRSRAPAWSVYFSSILSNVPFITTFHGTYGHRGSLGLKKFYNRIMLKGKCVIANSVFISDHLKKIYKVPENFIRIIQRGVDIDKFSPNSIDESKKIHLLKSWHIEKQLTKFPVLLLPGRLTRWKGQLVFLKALENLSHRKFLAILVGSDQGRKGYRQELENFITQAKLENNVKIVDHCCDMPTAYALSDFVISASTDPEAFGRVLAEAGALEKPVVATNHGGAKEIIIENKTGFLVKPGSSESLTEALEKILSLSEKERTSLGKESRLHIIKHFSKKVFQDKTLKVYREFLS